MSEQDIKNKLLKFVSDKADIHRPGLWSLPLRDVIDSVGMIELLAFLESTFGIVIEDEEVSPETFQSLQDVIDLIEKKLS